MIDRDQPPRSSRAPLIEPIRDPEDHLRWALFLSGLGEVLEEETSRMGAPGPPIGTNNMTGKSLFRGPGVQKDDIGYKTLHDQVFFKPRKGEF